MEAIRVEVLDPKAMQLIEGMQNLNLIRISDEPASKIKAYLKKTRRNAATTPSLEEITKIVEEVRTKRYAQK